MPTPNFGWTYPALGSANNVPADIASALTQVDATVGDLHDDTGWSGVTLAGGLGGSLAVRAIGNTIYLKGTVTKADSFATSYLTIGTLPAWAAPPAAIRRAIGGYASGTPNSVIGTIATNGVVTVASVGTASSEAYFTGLSWLVD